MLGVPDSGHTEKVNIEVTRILGDGSIRRVSVQPEERADADHWRELVDRANLALPPPYNPARAKALGAEAGFPNGLRLTLHGPNDRYVNNARIIQAVGQMW